MVRRLVVLSMLMAVLMPRPSYAYLDPTSGSILLQVLLGGLAGAALALRLFWHKIVAWFGGKRRDHDDPTA